MPYPVDGEGGGGAVAAAEEKVEEGIQNPPPSSIRCGERIRYCGEKEIEGCRGSKWGYSSAIKHPPI